MTASEKGCEGSSISLMAVTVTRYSPGLGSTIRTTWTGFESSKRLRALGVFVPDPPHAGVQALHHEHQLVLHRPRGRVIPHQTHAQVDSGPDLELDTHLLTGVVKVMASHPGQVVNNCQRRHTTHRR